VCDVLGDDALGRPFRIPVIVSNRLPAVNGAVTLAASRSS